MGKTIYYEEGKVAATSWILSKLRDIASKENISETEIISDFIQDLRNWGKDGYENKVEKFIAEFDDSVREDVILKLTKELKMRQKIDKIRKKKEERKPKKEEKERIKKEIKAKETERKVEEEKKAKINKSWEEICKIVAEQSEDSLRPEYELWEAVKDLKFPEELSQQLTSVQSKVKQKLEDEIYYQKVKYYTFDFDFLSQFQEFARGTSAGRKISDNRYFMLRDELQEYSNEQYAIQTMLSNPSTDDVTRRILEERLQHMEKGKNEIER